MVCGDRGKGSVFVFVSHRAGVGGYEEGAGCAWGAGMRSGGGAPDFKSDDVFALDFLMHHVP